ncbi:MAG: hypothetical protein AB7S48_06065 [Bacteroidales bacterium]
MTDENARVFLRCYANELSNGFKLVTAHLVVRDNRNMFFFVENQNPSASGLLNYKVIDVDTIVLTDYPENIGNEVPKVVFYFSTDSEPTKEFKDFELFIQFCTKDVVKDKKALIIKGLRATQEAASPIFNEVETEEGIIWFPDVF